MDAGVIKEEIPYEHGGAVRKIEIDLEERTVKEERVSLDEAVVNEENVFLAEPIKIEHPSDIYDESSGYGISSAHLELSVANNESELPSMPGKVEVDDVKVNELADHGYGELKLEPNSLSAHPHQGKKNEGPNKADHGDQVRRTTNRQVHEVLRSARLVTEMQKSSSIVSFENCSAVESSQTTVSAEAYLKVRDENKHLFPQEDAINGHSRLPTGTILIQIDKCPKQLTGYSKLKCHQMGHTREKPNNCVKAFSHSVTLKYHQRELTGEKAFGCNECERSFRGSSDLKRHQRVHTGEKPFKCDECGRSFSRSDFLKVHQRVHTGEKPFKCDKCERFFSRSSNVKRHQRVHTGETR